MGLYWVGLVAGSVLDRFVLRVRTGWIGRRVCTRWVGGRVCSGWVGGWVRNG